MRRMVLCLVAASSIGCGDFQKAMEAPPRQNLATPSGVATTGDVSAVQNATGGVPVTPPANAQPGQPAAAPAAQPTEPAKKTGSILGKTDGKIVDLAEAKKNPKIVEIDGKIAGSDPLTASFNAYVSITSKASVLNFKHQMDVMKEINGGKDYPPFKEAMQLMKQMNVQVASQPPWQMYGYDVKTGGLVLLEDKGEKIRLFKANGIPIEEADKQYDTP